jgi:hypothetical protein
MSTVSVSALVGEPGRYDHGMYQTHLFLLHEGDSMAWEMIHLNNLEKPTVSWRPTHPEQAGEALLAMIGAYLLREPAPTALKESGMVAMETIDEVAVREWVQAAQNFDNIKIQVSGPESSLAMLQGIFLARGLVWAPFDELSPFFQNIG